MTRAHAWRAVVVAAGLLAAAQACSTFSSDTSSSTDGGATDSSPSDGAASDVDMLDAGVEPPFCSGASYQPIALTLFSEERPSATLDDAGVVTATATRAPDDTGTAYLNFDTPTGAYALEIDYDLEIAGTDGVDVEAGCVVIVHHPQEADAANPYTELYFDQSPHRSWEFLVYQNPAHPSFQPFKKTLAVLPPPPAQTTHAHLRLDLRNGRAAGSVAWNTLTTFDQALARPMDSVEINCGVNYASFKDASPTSTSLKISSFTGYVCAP